MGICCGNQIQYIDGSNIFEGSKIRRINFKEYIKIFDENKSNWIKTFELERRNDNTLDIKKFKNLYDLLDSPNFTDHQRLFFFSRLNKFLLKIPDLLIFLTSLSFFTKLESKKTMRNNSLNAKTNLDNLLEGTVKDEYDLIKEDLLKMCIKKYDHDIVTKLFIEFVTEFTLDFIFTEEESIAKAEKRKKFSNENREKLFLWLKKLSKEKFYSYLFDVKNIKKINQDLERLYKNEEGEEKNEIDYNNLYKSEEPKRNKHISINYDYNSNYNQKRKSVMCPNIGIISK